MKNKNIDKLLSAVNEVRGAVSKGVEVSKELISRSRKVAAKVLNRDSLSSGIEATSKGVANVAGAAKIASKGAGRLAATLEKASHKLNKLGSKVTRKS